MVGGTAENRRIFDGKQFHVSEEGIGIEARDLPRRTAGAARARFHLVFAGVCVRRQMTDVGDVHHMPDAIAVPLENALQDVLEEKSAEVADVLVVVHRRPAGVETDLRGLQRREHAQAAGEIVVERERSRHRCRGACGCIAEGAVSLAWVPSSGPGATLVDTVESPPSRCPPPRPSPDRPPPRSAGERLSHW